MSTMKKCKVVILPTKEKSSIRLTKTQGLQYKKKIQFLESQNPQHLYFLSDEKIKEGDWMIRDFDHAIIKDNVNSDNRKGEKFHKIIATTDSSLEIISKGINPVYEKLPQPGQAFLEVFVEEYNKGNIIKEVLVEYEEFFLTQADTRTDYVSQEQTIVRKDEIPKVNSKDNTITIKRIAVLLDILEHCLWYGRIHTVTGVRYEYTHKEVLDKLETYINTNYKLIQTESGNHREKPITIKKVKDNWTREEVKELINKLINDSQVSQNPDDLIYYNQYNEGDDYITTDGYYLGKAFDKWIEQNI